MLGQECLHSEDSRYWTVSPEKSKMIVNFFFFIEYFSINQLLTV